LRVFHSSVGSLCFESFLFVFDDDDGDDNEGDDDDDDTDTDDDDDWIERNIKWVS